MRFIGRDCYQALWGTDYRLGLEDECQFDDMSPRKIPWLLCQEELGLPTAMRPSLRDSKIAAVTTATAAA